MVTAEFGKLVADETEKWGKVIRAANIRAHNCPHLATAHELEALGADLMAKAAEVRELQEILQTDDGALGRRRDEA